MLQLVARHLSSVRVPLDRVVGAGVVSAFFWLLLGDRIPPATVYLLELFLTL